MDSAFSGKKTFNGDIIGWDTSQVTDMKTMFRGAAAFNQDIGGWDVSSVKTMQGMFNMQDVDTSTFNQDISAWDTSQVTNMKWMFKENIIFQSKTCPPMGYFWLVLDFGGPPGPFALSSFALKFSTWSTIIRAQQKKPLFDFRPHFSPLNDLPGP